MSSSSTTRAGARGATAKSQVPRPRGQRPRQPAGQANTERPKEAARRGLDPNKWFNNVEIVASEKIGRETVTYVSNIYKYYIAYKLATETMEERRKSKEEAKGSP